jgi:hypothetical protein
LPNRSQSTNEAPASLFVKTATTTNISSALKGKWDSQDTSYNTIFSSLDQETAGDIQLPSATQCAAHLELLDAFVILKAKVMHWGHSCGSDLETTWQIFVKLAAVRFTIWIRSLDPSEMKSSLPPLGMCGLFE